MGKLEKKRPLGSLRRRWERIRSDFKSRGWDGVDLIDLAEEWGKWLAVANTAMNLRVK